MKRFFRKLVIFIDCLRIEIQENAEEVLEYIFVALLVVLFVAFFFKLLEADRQWDAFSKEHNCQKVDTRTFSTAVIVGNSVIPMVVTDFKYKCNDGKEYWR
jgi:hypothetical protein